MASSGVYSKWVTLSVKMLAVDQTNVLVKVRVHVEADREFRKTVQRISNRLL